MLERFEPFWEDLLCETASFLRPCTAPSIQAPVSSYQAPRVLQRSHSQALSGIAGDPGERFTSAQNWAPQGRRFRRSEQGRVKEEEEERCGRAEMTRVGRGVEGVTALGHWNKGKYEMPW